MQFSIETNSAIKKRHEEIVLWERNTTLGGAEDLEVDVTGAFGDKISGLFGPLDAGDGLRVIYKINKTDILQFFKRIEAVAIEVIKRYFGFVDMHQDECRTLHLLRMLEPETFRKTLDKGGLPASELAFHAEDRTGLKVPSESLGKIDSFLG